MLRRFLLALWLCALALLPTLPAHAQAERRVALVIGNGNYPAAPLRNPVNDARDMAVALRGLGFEVIERTDVSQRDMNRAITQFGERVGGAAIALFFYAGHGIQIRGKNYLIPVDAQIASEASVRSEAVDVDALLEQVGNNPLNVVILDACRNNPFERRFRSASGGLAQMEAPKGTLIAYATAPGKVASDGEGRNGLYTQELLKLIQTPGLQVESVFKRVRANVARLTGDNQIPWESSSLTGDFYFRGGAAAAEAPAVAAAPVVAAAAGPDPRALELGYWQGIKDSSDAEDFREFLRRFPNGELAGAANSKLRQLTRPAAPPPARLANQPCPAGFAGPWKTSYGSMSLTVDGERVTGTWDMGRIEGTLRGNVLSANWFESAFLFSGSGTLQFTLAPDGRSFSGTWVRQSGFGNPGGSWNGACQS